jgi:hypothetical protein
MESEHHCPIGHLKAVFSYGIQAQEGGSRLTLLEGHHGLLFFNMKIISNEVKRMRPILTGLQERLI